MCKQIELDFYTGLSNEDLHDQIDEIAHEIEETTTYMKSLIHEMKLIDMVDDIFDIIYK